MVQLSFHASGFPCIVFNISHFNQKVFSGLKPTGDLNKQHNSPCQGCSWDISKLVSRSIKLWHKKQFRGLIPLTETIILKWRRAEDFYTGERSGPLSACDILGPHPFWRNSSATESIQNINLFGFSVLFKYFAKKLNGMALETVPKDLRHLRACLLCSLVKVNR